GGAAVGVGGGGGGGGRAAGRAAAGDRGRPRRGHFARLPHAVGRRGGRGRRRSDRPALVSEISVERQMWTLVRGAMATKALGLVADLGVADKLADGPRHVADLASETRTDEDSLYRFLRALASDGVFAEQDHRVFANTPLSELLITDRSDSWRDFAHLFGSVWYETFADAGGALDSGESTFANRFGSDFWAWLERNPSEGASFNRAMASGVDQQIDWLIDREWRDGETVVDV